jgi:3-methyladenine DNA glycosylase AlkD
VHKEFRSDNLKKRDHLEDLGIHGTIISKWILREIRWKGVDWIRLVQDRDQWRDLVKSLTKLRIP